jgi:hypothetical protein
MAANIDEFDDLFLTDEERAAKKRAQQAAKRKTQQDFDFSSIDDIPSLDNETPQSQKKKTTFDDSFHSLKESLGGSLFGNIDLDSKKKEAAKKWENLNEKAETFNTKADNAANEAMDFLGEKGKEAVDTAKDYFGKAKDYAYDLEEKMRKKDEEAESKLKNPKHKLGDDLLSSYDSLFEKAKGFNDRFQEKVKDKFNLGDDDGKIKIKKVEPPKDDTPTRILGFEDLDGDGDPIFDDAILD